MEGLNPNDYYKLFKGSEWVDHFGQVEKKHFLLEMIPGSTDHLSSRDRDDVHGFVIRHALARMTSDLHRGTTATVCWEVMEPKLPFFQIRG